MGTNENTYEHMNVRIHKNTPGKQMACIYALACAGAIVCEQLHAYAFAYVEAKKPSEVLVYLPETQHLPSHQTRTPDWCALKGSQAIPNFLRRVHEVRSGFPDRHLPDDPEISLRHVAL